MEFALLPEALPIAGLLVFRKIVQCVSCSSPFLKSCPILPICNQVLSRALAKQTPTGVGHIMANLVWDESFSVKVKCCDEHHQKLFSLIQRLQDSMGKPGDPVEFQNVVRELDDYAATHFSIEESLLEQTKFPGLENHFIQHKAFKTKLAELKEALADGSSTAPFVMVEYLKNWLIRHIKMVDCQYSKHLNANGIH